MYGFKIKAKKLNDLRNTTNANTPQASQTAPQSSSFYLNIDFKGKRCKLKTTVNCSTLIRTVKIYIHNQEIGSLSENDSNVDLKLLKLRIISLGKILVNSSTLQDCGIINGHNRITVMHNAHGGTYADTDDIYRSRIVNIKKFTRVKRSSKKDCITLEGDEGGLERAAMPCGHAISPDTMYMYIDSIFCKNEKSVRIICPLKKCAKEWDWQLCTEVADMTANEYEYWTLMRDKRLKATRDEKDCPHCGTTCIRKEGVLIYRMRCGICKKKDWCWECGRVWNHSGLMICGNSSCKVVTSLNKELNSCKTIAQAIACPSDEHKEMATSFKFLLLCPVIRACPNCMNLLYHLDRCKHMKCIGCSKRFCWYCLSIRGKDGKWPCGGSGDECSTKGFPRQPVQQFT